MSGHRAQEDFILAIQPLAPDNSATLHSQLIIKETAGQEIDSIEDHINNFQTHWRRAKPVQASLGAFGTLNISTPAAAETHKKRNQFGPKLNDDGNPKCICGSWHWFSQCPYLAKSARPKGWIPQKDISEKIDFERKKNPKLDRKIKRPLRRLLQVKTTNQLRRLRYPPIGMLAVQHQRLTTLTHCKGHSAPTPRMWEKDRTL